MPPSNDPIAAMLARYQAAVLEKSADDLLALYDHDVRVFDAWGRWACEGLQAWSGMAREWFDSLGQERVEVRSEEVRASLEGNTATAHGILVYTALDPTGMRLRSLRNRFTWVLRRGEGGWRIVHEHTSVPLDFETKSMLRPDAA